MTAVEGIPLPDRYAPKIGDELLYDDGTHLVVKSEPEPVYDIAGYDTRVRATTDYKCGDPLDVDWYFPDGDRYRLIAGPSFDELTAGEGVASTTDGGDDSRPFEAIRIRESDEGNVGWSSSSLMVSVDTAGDETVLSVGQDEDEVVFTARQFAALVEAAGLLGFTT